MFLTAKLFAKKAKSKHILVLLESMVSGHKTKVIRERLADKVERLSFDPYVQATVLYREKKKVRSVPNWKDKEKTTIQQ